MPHRVAVITFPGSNCDADLRHAVGLLDGLEAVAVFHKEPRLPRVDAVMLPGGFSYGDYLRCGALARFSPIMEDVVRFARRGGPVLGICNGFQILTEAGLLPGALVRNRGLRFLCQDVHLRVEGPPTAFTRPREGALRLPIAHMEGNWVAEPDEVRRVEEAGQVVLRYVDAEGRRAPGIAPNGSTHDVAGLCNTGRNVVGMMPHPERAVEEALGGTDGRWILGALRTWLEAR